MKYYIVLNDEKSWIKGITEIGLSLTRNKEEALEVHPDDMLKKFKEFNVPVQIIKKIFTENDDLFHEAYEIDLTDYGHDPEIDELVEQYHENYIEKLNDFDGYLKNISKIILKTLEASEQNSNLHSKLIIEAADTIRKNMKEEILEAKVFEMLCLLIAKSLEKEIKRKLSNL